MSLRKSSKVAVLAGSLMVRVAFAQQTPATFQRYAPINVTGNWVSIVNEDWEQRMLPVKKGDYSSMPLNAAAVKIANAWDPAKDVAAGDACKGYAAPGLLRIPGRLRISWQDGGATLRLETDAGQQSRSLQFAGTEPAGEQGWQGFSAATWEYANGFDPARLPEPGVPQQGPGRGPRRGAPPATPQGGSLKVVTTHLKPGYLRKNGVPFSRDAILTEYFNVYPDPYGTDWMVVTSIVHDPTYLTVDYITSTNFKREADASKWRPRPCSAD